MDTRTGAGGVGIGRAAARSTLSFRIAGVAGVPNSGVTAVVLYLTAIRPSRTGVLVAFPAGTTRPSIVSASFTTGESVTSMVLVRPGAVRRASVYNGSTGATHLRADVIGYFAPITVSPAGSPQVSVPPRRIADTRTGAGGVPRRPVAPRGTVSFPVAVAAGVPRDGVTAVLLQLTAVGPRASGALVGFPTGTRRPSILSASLTAGENVTATVLIPRGRDRRVSVYNGSAGSTHLRVDVVGYFAAPSDPVAGSGLVPVPARRIMDTRTGAGGVPRRPVLAGRTVSFPVVGVAGVPTSRVTGTLVHLTTIRPTTSGGLIGFPAGSLRRPGIVSASFAAGETVTTTLLLRPGAAGKASVFNGSAAGIHLRADVVGYLRPIPPGWTTRASVTSAGMEASGDSSHPKISADGRYLVFHSTAANLVRHDTNRNADVFLYDRLTATTTRVSVANDGTEANLGAAGGSPSADGRYIGFSSSSTNLVQGDTNETVDAFLRDRNTGTTSIVSVGSDGIAANGPSFGAHLSGDGRYVAFTSRATNLVVGDTDNHTDIFVRDQMSGITTRVSVASDGTQANDSSGGHDISADGRYVAFLSHATNLVSGDTNNLRDVFLHDRVTGSTTRVSVASDGTEANGASESAGPSLSADGRYIAFTSSASNLVPGDTNNLEDLFVHDRVNRATTRVGDGVGTDDGLGGVRPGTLSGDGRYVVFLSRGHLYVHDRSSGLETPANLSTDGVPTFVFDELGYSISGDGRSVAFAASAATLVPGDTNNSIDVFIRDRQ
jgi:Tol biopolymer transport system component